MNALLMSVFGFSSAVILAHEAPCTLELEERNGVLCNDGDTCNVRVLCLPPQLRELKIRLDGLDTPEIGKAKCPRERDLGIQARDFLNNAIRNGGDIKIEALKWGSFSRVIARVWIDQKDIALEIINAKLGYKYSERSKKALLCPQSSS